MRVYEVNGLHVQYREGEQPKGAKLVKTKQREAPRNKAVKGKGKPSGSDKPTGKTKSATASK